MRVTNTIATRCGWLRARNVVSPDDALVDYLVTIETGYMGLADTPAARSRAEATVAAIREQLEGIQRG